MMASLRPESVHADHLIDVRSVSAGGIATRYATCQPSSTSLGRKGVPARPAVLVHGGHFGTHVALDCWDVSMPALARDRIVVALDRVGQGHTANPATPDGYRFETVLGHFTAFLDVLGFDKAHLVGHSRGGLVALLTALDQPDRVASLTIVDSHTASPTDTDRAFPPGVFYEALDRELQGVPSFERIRARVAAQAYDPSAVSDAYVRRLLDAALLPKTAEASAMLEGEASETWRRSLDAARKRATGSLDARQLRIPALVTWGRHDPSAPLPLGIELYDRVAASAPLAEFHVFGRSGHSPFRDEPAAFARVVTGFWDRIDEQLDVA